MAKYAVVRIKGHQYKVSEGEELLVDKLGQATAEAEVLMVVDGGKVNVGKPVLKDAKIKLKTIGETKGEKIRVYKYKSKSRYNKTIGFRPCFSKLLVEKIS